MADSDVKASQKRRSKWRHLKRREGRNFTGQVLRYVPLLSLLLRILEFIFKYLTKLYISVRLPSLERRCSLREHLKLSLSPLCAGAFCRKDVTRPPLLRGLVIFVPLHELPRLTSTDGEDTRRAADAGVCAGSTKLGLYCIFIYTIQNARGAEGVQVRC